MAIFWREVCHPLAQIVSEVRIKRGFFYQVSSLRPNLVQQVSSTQTIEKYRSEI